MLTRIVLALCAGIPLFGQPSAVLAPVFKQQFFDNNGRPCSGCLLWTYAAGTTSGLVTYTAATGAAENTNPIVLNGAGRPQFNIFLGPHRYKAVLEQPPVVGGHGKALYTVDNVGDEGQVLRTDLLATTGAAAIGYKRPATGSVGTTVAAALARFASVEDFTADTVREQLDLCLADANADVCVVPSGIDSGTPTSIPTGKMLLDYRRGTYCIKTSLSVDTCALEVSAAGMLAGSTIDPDTLVRTDPLSVKQDAVKVGVPLQLTPHAPSSTGDLCVAGTIYVDTHYISVCTNTNELRRTAPLSPWPGASAYYTSTGIPACAALTLFQRLFVIDAGSATPGDAYTGGGTVSIAVQCTYDSSTTTYSWLID